MNRNVWFSFLVLCLLFCEKETSAQVYVPANGSTGISFTPTLSWTPGVNSYSLQLSTWSDFSSWIVNVSGLTSPSYTVGNVIGGYGLSSNTKYYWHVNYGGGWSQVQSFTTMTIPTPGVPTLTSPANGAAGISLSPTLSWNPSSNAASYYLEISTDPGFGNNVAVNTSIIGTSYNASTSGIIRNGTQYFWHVLASNAAGYSTWSNAWSFTTIVAAPVLSSPTNGATGISINPTLGWNACTGATSYNLQVSTSSSFSTIFINQTGITGNSYDVSGLASNIQHYWRVSAVNSGNTSSWSTVWSFTTIPPPAAPILISPINGAINTAISPTLSWNTTSGATTYRIQVSTDSGFASLLVDDSTFVANSKIIGPLISSTTYYWRLNAKNVSGNSAWSLTRHFSTIFVAPPSVPTLASPLSGAINISLNPILSWNASVGTFTYRLQVSTDASFSAIVFDDSTIVSTTKTIATLASGTAYFWRINAKNAGGTSDWSMIWSFSTVPPTTAAPILSSPLDSSANISLNPTLTWGATTGATTYRIQVSTDSGFITKIVDDSTLSLTSKTMGPLNPSTTYYWRVNAKNTGGTSLWSTVWRFSTVLPIAVAPILISPANNSSNNITNPVLMWNTTTNAATYHLQVSTNSSFTTRIFDDSTLTLPSKTIGSINPGTTYYWRINAKNSGGTGPWSSVWSFATGAVSVLPTTYAFAFTGTSLSKGIIHYAIPKQSLVSLAMYDISGRLVRNYISDQQLPGFYSVNLDQNKLANGQYFIRFLAGNYERIFPLFVR